MRELTGNLFQPATWRGPSNNPSYMPPMPDGICITTNGFVKKNGDAVMGRGCAKTAATMWPGVPSILGSHLKNRGNKVYTFGPVPEVANAQLISFPVKQIWEKCLSDKSNVVKHMQKRFSPGDRVPGWACCANVNTIISSSYQLIEVANYMNLQNVVLPRPGCGAGEADWKDIGPLLDDILDNRFWCITY